jgi:hypothetical protein
MKRIRLLGMMLVAIFAFSAVIASVAAAEEKTKVLPEATAASPLTSTGKGGAGVLLTVRGREVTCESGTGSGAFTSANLGTFHTTFIGCKTKADGATLRCTGTEDREGQILLLGTVHYWLALLSARLVAALVFLFVQFHFTCTILTIKELVLVRGCAAALAEPTEKLTALTKDVFTEASSGVSDITEVLPQEARAEIRCITETKVGEAEGDEFEQSSERGTAENERFEKEKRSVEVLLMN